MRVGFVGWRGMVGSVLMQRMLEERDFELIEPTFFTTSNVGGKGPAIGRETPPLRDATDIKALAAHDAIMAIGFATPLPAMSGADPCTGS